MNKKESSPADAPDASGETSPSTSSEPVGAYKAADALEFAENNPIALAPDEEGESPQGPVADQDESSAEPNEETEPEEYEEGDKEGDEAEELGDEVPELDPLLEELAKGNPKAEKRIREIAEGLQKLKTETKQLKADLGAAQPKADSWDLYEKALGAADTAGPALERLVLAVAHHHRVTPAELLTTLMATASDAKPQLDENGQPIPEWTRRGYASAREYEMANELRLLKDSLRGFQHDRDQLQKERAEARELADFKHYVDEIAPKAIRRIERLESGWKITKAMVEKAIREFPQLKDDPVRAVKAMYPDELKAHYAKLSAITGKSRGPEMLPEAHGRGRERPEPGRYSAADALADIAG